MEAYIIMIDWTFRGESGLEVIDTAYTNIEKAKKRFREVIKDEYEDSWLNEVLDKNLTPLDGLALEEYELTDDYLVVECAEYRGRTEVWIQKFNLV